MLFWLIYATSSKELGARTAEFGEESDTKTASWEIQQEIEKLNTDTILKNVEAELLKKITKEEFDKFQKNFGKMIVKFYKNIKIADDKRFKIPTYILNLKDKDMKYVVDYFVRDIKKRGEKLKRRWHKRIASFK